MQGYRPVYYWSYICVSLEERDATAAYSEATYPTYFDESTLSPRMHMARL